MTIASQMFECEDCHEKCEKTICVRCMNFSPCHEFVCHACFEVNMKYFEIDVDKVLKTHGATVKHSGLNLCSLSWKHGVTAFAIGELKQARMAAAVYIHLWQDKEVFEPLAAGCAEAIVKNVPAVVTLKDNRSEQ